MTKRNMFPPANLARIATPRCPAAEDLILTVTKEGGSGKLSSSRYPVRGRHGRQSDQPGPRGRPYHRLLPGRPVRPGHACHFHWPSIRTPVDGSASARAVPVV